MLGGGSGWQHIGGVAGEDRRRRRLGRWGGRSQWLYSDPKTTPHRMIDSSGLFVPHGPFSLLSASMAPLAAHKRLSQVPQCVCVCV